MGYADCPNQNDPDSTGVGPLAFNNPDGVRWSTAIGYLGDARHRLNLTIRADCLVHRVLLEGGRAVGVQVESSGELFTAYGDKIVLSAGAVSSPHMLMLSGVGPADQLRDVGVTPVRDMPGVGQNLRDHPYVMVSWRTKPEFEQDLFDIPLQTALRYTANGSDLRNDMIIFPTSHLREGGSTLNRSPSPLASPWWPAYTWLWARESFGCRRLTHTSSRCLTTTILRRSSTVGG